MQVTNKARARARRGGVARNRSVGFLPLKVAVNALAPYQAKMRSTTAGLLLLIGSANSLSLGLAPVRRSAVHRLVMQVSERQPH